MGIYSHVANWKNTLTKLGFGQKKSKRATRSNNVSSADYTIWQDQNGSVGAYEEFSADASDDGHVDAADYAIWSQNYGHTLQLFDIGA